LELRILAIIDGMGTEGSAAYGFSVATALSAQGGKRLTAHGTLYKAMARMTEAGLLDSHWESPEIAEGQGRPRRRLYSITNNGKAALAAVSRTAPARTPAPSFKPVQA
jgi:DNA-binding PadR family transcriptional regulator